MLLVFGPRSTTYDFGPRHPLTPRRFGPGIDLIREVGGEPGLAPEPATDDQLGWVHEHGYIDTVKRFSVNPFGFPEAGISEGGDTPPFAGMHEASAAVAGGSIVAIEAILRGDTDHAFHPGGGLHHAMADRASGFCVYNDPALAIARARADGLRVLYVDLDVHHGDGVQAAFWDDPGVLTFSIHETGRALFPGSGDAWEIGERAAAGTSVNVPVPPETGEGGWLGAVRSLIPELAAAFGPDVIVSQHGADSHAWDPLAHLNVTTTAMGEAARLVHELSHGAGVRGRWLATGGGGYDAYRVVPRTWAHVWLEGSHREVPAETPRAWRERWATEAARYGQTPLPTTFDDPPGAGLAADPVLDVADRGASSIAALVRRALVPRLIREAVDRGWWRPLDAETKPPVGSAKVTGDPVILPRMDRAIWSTLALEAWTIPPASPAAAHALIDAALADGAQVAAAAVGPLVAGIIVTRAGELLALGVAPGYRRRGLATRLIAEAPFDRATVTVAERDPFDPLDHLTRVRIASRLLERAGSQVAPADEGRRSVDRLAIVATRS